MIRAEVHSDDHNCKVEFDATKWIEQASDEEILALVECGYRGDYPADVVAEFYGDTVTKPLFDYLGVIRNDPSKKDCCGFECSVEPVDVRCWLDLNKHDLLEQINADA